MPLCPMYMCQNVNQATYLENLQNVEVSQDVADEVLEDDADENDGEVHVCFGGDLADGLMYVKRYGI